jgi:chorismate-pyruvate lyase
MPATNRAPRSQRNVRQSASAHGMLYPLDVLYAQAGIPGPVAKRTTAEKIPAPYDKLLVHQNEMTSTLEQHFGGRVAVRVLSASVKGRSYFRRVLLVMESSARPVAMGAVRILLDAFTPRVRARVLRQQEPLGRILRDARIDYGSRPTNFLEVTPNSEMLGVFWMPERQTLYGRQTQVTVGDARVGDIVEILPLV